ncbi:MAG: hypothetical protein Q8Q12_08065 [bacterium]|nr:hypothetical protein [bacterium]
MTSFAYPPEFEFRCTLSGRNPSSTQAKFTRAKGKCEGFFGVAVFESACSRRLVTRGDALGYVISPRWGWGIAFDRALRFGIADGERERNRGWTHMNAEGGMDRTTKDTKGTKGELQILDCGFWRRT